MSFPEIPLLIYPSLAKRFGVEESILYYICEQLLASVATDFQGSENAKISVSKDKWLKLTNFWDEERLAQVVASLIGQGVVNIEYLQDEIVIEARSAASEPLVDKKAEIVQSISSGLLPEKKQTNSVNSTVPEILRVKGRDAQVQGYSAPAIEPIHVLPVYDVPPTPASRPLPMRRSNDEFKQTFQLNTGELLKGVGHAPSFGGFRKRSNASDPFEKFLDDKEQQNKKLYSMTMDWEPSKLLFNTLKRSNIPHDVAISCLDEFRLYYCDRNNKERSWDQKFLAWVKKTWVKKQSADNRAQNVPSQAGFKHENSQRDSREKRKRITAAIMDIHDTNW